MKKIMFYTMTMAKGGAEKNISFLANNYAKNCNVTIVVNICQKCEYKLNDKISIRYIDDIDKSNENVFKKIITKISNKRTKKLRQIINEINPDIIIAFLPEPSIRLLKLRNYFPNIKFIISIRNNPIYEFKGLKYIRNYYYKRADIITIQDDGYKTNFNNQLKLKMIVIPNSIENISFDRNNVKKKIVSVGRLEKQKNFSLLIKAYSKIKYKDFKLFIYGVGSQYNCLQKMIKKYHMSNNIFLVGRVKDIYTEIQDASMFILPSNYEGMPNVLLEAMYMGLPVITTDSTKNIVTNGYDGLIVKKKSIKQMVQAIEYLIEDEVFASQLGINAMTVRDKYNETEIIKKWDEIINE